MIIKKSYYVIIALLLLTFSFWGCDSIPGDVIDSPVADESIVMISVPSQVNWSADDSSFVVSISLVNRINIDSMKVHIVNKSGINEIGKLFQLTDDGENGDQIALDGIYSGEPYMLSTMASGSYNLEYFKYSNNGSDQKLASVNFTYNNGQQNYPPEISNLVMPASVSRDENFVIHLTVTDPNGLANIQAVVFKLTRPDGTKSMDGNSEYWHLIDNGSLTDWGDEVRNDGIFSRKSLFPQGVQIGAWTFEFRAIDKAGAESNIITNSMVVE